MRTLDIYPTNPQYVYGYCEKLSRDQIKPKIYTVSFKEAKQILNQPLKDDWFPPLTEKYGYKQYPEAHP